jgi:hypothetical protein
MSRKSFSLVFLCVPLRPLRLGGESSFFNRRVAEDAEVRGEDPPDINRVRFVRIPIFSVKLRTLSQQAFEKKRKYSARSVGTNVAQLSPSPNPI